MRWLELGLLWVILMQEYENCRQIKLLKYIYCERWHFFLLFMRKNLVGTLETSVVMHLQNLCLQAKKYGKLPPLQHSSKNESNYCRFCHLKDPD